MLKAGLLLVSLTLSLTGCGTEIVYRERPVPVEVVEYRPTPVDRALLRDCPPVPMSGVETNGDLLAAALEANKRLRQCSVEKAQLRGLLNGAQ